MMAVSNSCSADSAEKCWSTTKQVHNPGRARLGAQQAVAEIRLKVNLNQHILKEKLKKLREKKTLLEYEAAVWGTEMPAIKIEDTAAACNMRAEQAKETLGGEPELELEEDADDDAAIDLAVQAETKVSLP